MVIFYSDCLINVCHTELIEVFIELCFDKTTNDRVVHNADIQSIKAFKKSVDLEYKKPSPLQNNYLHKVLFFNGTFVLIQKYPKNQGGANAMFAI